MPFPGPEEFARQFRAFTREDAEAFVADLWRACGWDVQRTDGGFHLTHPERGPPRSLSIVGSGVEDGGFPNADVVVTPTGDVHPDVPDDCRMLDVGDLYDMSEFGVEVTEREDLLASHFEQEPSTDVPATGNAGIATDIDGGSPTNDAIDSKIPTEGIDTPQSSGSRGATGVHTTDATDGGDDGVTGSGSEDSADSSRLNRRTVLVGSGAVLAGAGMISATGALRDEDSSLEPVGLTADGVINPAGLAEAHAAELKDRSYTLSFDLVVKNADRSLRSYLSMSLSLGAERSYLTRVSNDGATGPDFLGEQPSSAVYWSDGDTYMVKHSAEEARSFTAYRPPHGVFGTWHYWAWRLPFGGEPGSRPDAYLRSVFAEVPTDVIARYRDGGMDRYRVVTDGQRHRATTSMGEADLTNIRDVRLDALVDERSLVDSFDLRFLANRNGKELQFHRTVEYRALGETSIERPTWAD